MIRWTLAVSAGLAFAAPASAADRWYEARSDNFVVYSAGSEADARNLATNMERLNGALRMIRGMPPATQPVADSVKLRLYQFGETSDIAELYGDARSGVAGFFIPHAGRSVAFVPLREDRQRGVGTRTDISDIEPSKVLFHEYTHYFMFQNAAAAYPFWYVEGFAELFGTLNLTENGFNLGEPPQHRAETLKRLALDVRKVFDPPTEGDGNTVMSQYAHGWMVASYLSFEPKRKGQLANYLKRINAGEDNLVAAQNAFGDLDVLQQELEAYRKGRVRAVSVTYSNYKPPAVSVRQLAPDEADRMRVHIRSARGVTEGRAKSLVAGARALVAQYPSSLPVLMTALEAEFDAHNYDAAEALAKRALAIDAQAGTAHRYLGDIAFKRAKKDPAQIKIARGHYVAANRADPNDPQALMGYYLSYVFANEAPSKDALIGLDKAYDLAPFDSDIRTTLTHQLLLENRDKEALLLLGPILNDPHKGKRAKKYRELVEKLKAGDRGPLIAKLEPKLDPVPDKEDDGGEGE